ncbi:peptidase S24/S26A/S26B/S26C [Trametes maxima]|nr:peptidase S24/S26A/S26B/S26C [Trametes maxima]
MAFGRFAERAWRLPGELLVGAWRTARSSPQRLWQAAQTRQFWLSVGYRTLQIANVGCALHLIGEHVATISFVEGPSMFPTMNMTGEATIELKWINVHNLQRGDLVTYVSPLDPTRRVCKRITGLPGDVICVDPTGQYAPSTEHVVIPKNHIWVTGDNLPWSRDSRMYGPVPLGLVKGKLWARIWPIRDRAIFRSTFEFID